MKLEIICNNGVIKDLESWTNLMLNLINQSRLITSQSGEMHQDSATPINVMLDKISKLETENLNLQLKLIAQSRKSKLSEKQVEEVKTKYSIVESDLIQSNTKVLEAEKSALLESVISITEELDVLTSSNMKYKSELSTDGNQILSLMKELELEKQENKDLKSILLSPCVFPLDSQLLEVR